MTAHIFISYARSDGREFAERLEKDLQAAGFTTWLDKRDIVEYRDFTAELEQAIEQADVVIVCLTPAVDSNSFVRREIQYALLSDKRIIPLRFADVTPPIHIINRTWIDFYVQSWDQSLDTLIQRLKLSSETFGAPVAPPDPYQDYLTALYDQIVAYLQQTVFALGSTLIDLRAEPSSEAVVERQAIPLAFFELSGIDIPKGQSEAFNSFHHAFEYYGGRILLLGEPGAGKTTTLMAFVRDAVARRLDDFALPLPILAPISTWDTKKPLVDWLAEVVPILRPDDLARLITEGRMLLALDGLDELGDEREEPKSKALYDPRARFLELIPPGGQVIITCRRKDYEEIGKKASLAGAVTLQPLDDDQIAGYLEGFPDLQKLVDRVAELREMVRTPWLLSILIYVSRIANAQAQFIVDTDEGLNELLHTIFQDFARLIYQGERRKPLETEVAQLASLFTLDQIQDGLEILAAFMYMQPWRMYAPTPASMLRDYQLEIAQINRDLIRAITALNIFIVVDGENNIGFSTNIIRDSLVFQKLTIYLDSPEAEFRFGAARGLGLLKDKRAIPILLRTLRVERDTYVRHALTIALDDLKPEHTIFFSYRRRDWSIAFLLQEKISKILEANIFIDRYIDDPDFEKSILKHLRESSVFVLIVTEKTFAADRIHLEQDWVRKEIREAINKDIPIVLALIDDTLLPTPLALPKAIRGILTKQGIRVHSTSYEENVGQIADFITTFTRIKRKRQT